MDALVGSARVICCVEPRGRLDGNLEPHSSVASPRLPLPRPQETVQAKVLLGWYPGCCSSATTPSSSSARRRAHLLVASIDVRAQRLRAGCEHESEQTI